VTNLLDKEVAELRTSLPLMLTVAEAADVSRNSPSTVRRAIDAGKLPFNQRGGGTIYVPRDAVLAWAFTLELKKAPTSPKRPPRTRERRERATTAAAGKPSARRKPLRLSIGGQAVERLTPEAMREFAAAYAS
jgi:excisionase family DNA binding protein